MRLPDEIIHFHPAASYYTKKSAEELIFSAVFTLFQVKRFRIIIVESILFAVFFKPL